jgi:DNA-binding XRE family transcriptional regulator
MYLLDKNLFKSAFVKKGYTQDTLSEALGVSPNTMSSRITGKSCFNTEEIDRLCELLDITDNREKADIFLAAPSQKWEEGVVKQ